MFQVLRGGVFDKLRKALIAVMALLMLGGGAVLLTSCGESTEYSILLLDEDRTTVLFAQNVSAGDAISGVPTPTKESDAEYTYKFSGWVDENGNSLILSFAKSDITAYATYTATAREYGLTIKANDVTVSSYDQVEVLLDGKYLTTGSTLHYGDRLTITVNGSEGYTVSGNVNYSGLERISENGEIVYVVIGDVTISFSETANTYTVTFLNYDGNQLYATPASYGSSVVYPNEAPTRATDAIGSYVFIGWVDSDKNYVDLTRITGNTTVYASYSTTYTPYTLTIQTGANVTVSKNGSPLSSGSTIYYGDLLTIETNPTAGHYVSTLAANGTDITTGVWTAQGNTEITYAETIYTFDVIIYNQAAEDAEYTEYLTIENVQWGATPSFTAPTKTQGNRATYTLLGYVDSNGNEISLSNIQSNGVNIEAYAVYTETKIKYSLYVSENLTITLNGTDLTYNTAGTTSIYYGDTFTVKGYTVADGYTFNSIEATNASLNDGAYTIEGNVTLRLLIEKTFIFEMYDYENMIACTQISDRDGTVLATATSDSWTVDDGYVFYNYVGEGEINPSATYSDLEMNSITYTLNETVGSSSHVTNYTSDSYTWRGYTDSQTLMWQDYVTTPLYKGTTVEFTLNYPTTAQDFIFGISTEDDLLDAVNHTWRNASSANNGSGAAYLPTYHVYSGSSDSYLIYLYQYSNKSYFNTNAFNNSTTYTDQSSISVKIVLGTYLQIYINGVEVSNSIYTDTGWGTEKYNTKTDWTLDNNTRYYFSIVGGNNISITFTGFGYASSTYESAFLSSLSGGTLTTFGDSITYGIGTTDDDGEAETDEALAKGYAPTLASSLGMTLERLGTRGATYTTSESGAVHSKLSDLGIIPSTSDIIIVYLGINDFSSGKNGDETDYGSLGDETTIDDTSTIYGAANSLYSYLYNQFVSNYGTKVYICTPSPTKADTVSEVTSAKGYTLTELGNTIKTIAASYGFGVIDIYNGIDWAEDDFYDWVHPNNGGHAQIADYIYNYLLSEYILSLK